MGAFISKHALRPQRIAPGRPDGKDIKTQVDFGKEIYKKIIVQKDLTLHQQPKTDWSTSERFNKTIAYRETSSEEYSLTPEYKEKIISERCIQCGTCFKNCPAAAVNFKNKIFDFDTCLGCNGCVNRCPQQAITLTSKKMLDTVDEFEAAFTKRREPDLFF